jgi:dienelactone hydrolase
MRSSPSWKSLQGRPDFERLVEICQGREAAAHAAASPRLVVELPEGASPTVPAPVLVAVHGNGDHAGAALDGWRPLLAQGWAVAAVQSSQVSGPERFGWFDQELAVREIEELISTLDGRAGIDAQRMMIAGFQLGGEPALRVALRRRVPVPGFVLIDPFGPATPPAAEWASIVTAQPVSGLRGRMLLAAHALHLSHDVARSIAAVLSAHGVPCDVRHVPGLGYGYLVDVWPAFSEALAFIEAA